MPRKPKLPPLTQRAWADRASNPIPLSLTVRLKASLLFCRSTVIFDAWAWRRTFVMASWATRKQAVSISLDNRGSISSLSKRISSPLLLVMEFTSQRRAAIRPRSSSTEGLRFRERSRTCCKALSITATLSSRCRSSSCMVGQGADRFEVQFDDGEGLTDLVVQLVSNVMAFDFHLFEERAGEGLEPVLGRPHLQFRPLALGDVFHYAFVVCFSPFVPNSTRVHGDPYPAPVVRYGLAFEGLHYAVFDEELGKAEAVPVVGEEIGGQGPYGHHLPRGIESVHAGKGRVDVQESAVSSCLKNAFHRILEDVPVFAFAFPQRLFSLKLLEMAHSQFPEQLGEARKVLQNRLQLFPLQNGYLEQGSPGSATPRNRTPAPVS